MSVLSLDFIKTKKDDVRNTMRTVYTERYCIIPNNYFFLSIAKDSSQNWEAYLIKPITKHLLFVSKSCSGNF